MDGYSWEELEAFVRKEAAVSSKREITKDTTVSGDLGQTGDDADMFMERFFEFFGIDRGDYDFNRYFLMEGEGLLYHFLRKYILRRSHTFNREELTVGMLDKALVLGRWDSEAVRK
ncbi:DUF1493 family protein [Burkholderia sp. MSMB1589WGS]|uniref:DUF1493 family protein n=1 Tax=Burkholderia sp. MSMB1589WGS TaxID=1636425 RepID=UPI0007BA5164|nr:DUF1493 family protein [Burkholderia sp. MSMB1589WGS]